MKLLTLTNSFPVLSKGWLLKLLIMIKLLYELETKPIIPARKSKKSVIESKGGYIMILLTILLFSDSTLRWNLHFESKS